MIYQKIPIYKKGELNKFKSKNKFENLKSDYFLQKVFHYI